MAYSKKYKPCILKYKALISKYMPYIFRLSKCLTDSNLQKLQENGYLSDFLWFTKMSDSKRKKHAACMEWKNMQFLFSFGMEVSANL